MTMIFSVAAAGLASAAYYWTKRGIPQLGLEQADLQAVAKGFMKGTLHDDDLDNIMQCMADPEDVVGSIERAIGDFSKKDLEMADVMASLTRLGTSFHKLVNAIKNCDNEVTQEEVKILMKMLESFKDPKELAYKIGANIAVNGVDIYREMSAAYTNYMGKEYEAFGKDIGISMTLIFIGASNAARVNPGAAKVMESMAEMNLYPQLTMQVYDDKDNSAYVRFLAEIANSEDPTSAVPDYNVQLVNLAQLQPVRLDQQTYASLINLLSQQQQNAYLY
jgi:hypothetical protein